ncbi:unnamed protein product [Gordionus sp. m RMFG-2023]
MSCEGIIKEMFLIRALEKILADKEIKKSYNAELRSECLKALDDIRSKIKYNPKNLSSSVLPKLKTGYNDNVSPSSNSREINVSMENKTSKENIYLYNSEFIINAEDYFLPFQIACQSRSPRIMIIALDCIQKLIAYGHLTGANIDPFYTFDTKNNSTPSNDESAKDQFENRVDGGQNDQETPFSLLCPVPGWEYINNKFIDRIVRVVCGCMSNEGVNEDVYLQIIKALLTILTSNSCEIHESSLLLAIRTCYNIHLGSKNIVNQTTAKATLNQMISLIFNKMEMHNSEYCLKHCGLMVDESKHGNIDRPLDINDSKLDIDLNVSYKQLSQLDENENDFRYFMEDEIEFTVATLVEDMLSRIEQIENTISKDYSHMPSFPLELRSESAVHPDFVARDRRSKPSKLLALSAYRCKTAYTLRRDAFLVFRALCRLALKHVNHPVAKGGGNKRDRHHLQQRKLHMLKSKIMSLQLLTSIIDSSGPVFLFEESAFKYGVCYHVMAAILPYFPILMVPEQNAIYSGNYINSFLFNGKFLNHESNTTTNKSLENNSGNDENGNMLAQTDGRNEEIFEDIKLFEICVHLFGSAMKMFKKNMKLQIEIFFKEIYLNVLESSFSDDYKLIVLNSLYSFCENPQNVVDLYVNYDCDLSAANLFSLTVSTLSKIIRQQNIEQTVSSSYSSHISNYFPFQPSLHTNLPNFNNFHIDDMMAEETTPLRLASLACLVRIGQGMCQWCTDLYDLSYDSSKLDSNNHNGSHAKLESQMTPEILKANVTDLVRSDKAGRTSKLDHRRKPFNINSRADSFTISRCKDADNIDNKKLDNVAKDREKIDYNDGDRLSIDPITHSKMEDDEDTTKLLRGDHPAKYENLKQIKETIETGIEIFRANPTKGILYLQRNTKLMGSSSIDVARFLYNESRLDKTAVGDYLGDNDDFHKEVMYAYIDLMDFKGKGFVQALRQFLERFKLPGEAQKVDRLMQKFASRYVETTNYGNGIFQSADSAYVLAFSIIMLTTDLHNPQVKRKMTKEEYIRINKSSSDQKDLPEAYLSQIYDEIAENRFNVKDKTIPEEDVNKNMIQDNEFTSAIYIEHVRPMFKITWTPQLAAYSVCLQDCENLDIVALCLEGMKHAIRIACIFQLELEKNAYIQALSHFTLLYFSSSATSNSDSSSAFFHNASMTESPLIKSKNLMTINTFISIAETEGNYMGTSWFDFLKCISQLELAKIIVPGDEPSNLNYSNPPSYNFINESFISPEPRGLTHDMDKFSEPSRTSKLFTKSNINDETSSVISSTSHLSSSYNISASEPYNLVQPSSKTSTLRNSSLGINNLGQSNASDNAKQSLLVKVDKIFANSIMLDGEAICDFVRALCKVSSEELLSAVNIEDAKRRLAISSNSTRFWKKHLPLSDDSTMIPRVRMFSLQKIVEISYYNMARIRLQWSKIWDVLGPYFNKVGCHPNEAVSFFALDSLRQLSTKFLEKGELSNFRFQKDFLRPFEYIIKHNKSLNVADMTIRCVDQMIRAQAHNIKSGWKNIFSIFQIVASNYHDQNIFEMSFQSLNYVIGELSEKDCDFAHNLIDSFQNLIKCLAEFACHIDDQNYQKNKFPTSYYLANIHDNSTTPDFCREANQSSADINMEAIRLIRLCAAYVHAEPRAFKDYTYEEINVCEDDYPWVKGWFPILFELSCVINRCSLDIRTRALTVMFEILKSYGQDFSPHWWKDFFRVLFRIFDNFKIPNAKSQKSEWMNTTCNHALYAIVDIFSQFYEPLCTTLLPEFYQQLKWCLKQGNEQLARAAIFCLENLILSNGIKFGVKEWDSSCNILIEIFNETLPMELLDHKLWKSGSLEAIHNNDKIAMDSPFLSQNDSRNEIQKSDRDLSLSNDFQNSLTLQLSSHQIDFFNLPKNVVKFSKSSNSKTNTNLHRPARHNTSPDTNFISTLCVVQLELINCVEKLLFHRYKKRDNLNNFNNKSAKSSISSSAGTDIIFYELLTSRQVISLAIEFAWKSHVFAAKFNADNKLRESIYEAALPSTMGGAL